MTLENIKEVYDVYLHKGQYLLWSKTETGKRMARKYCGHIYKSGRKFHAQGFESTNSIEELQIQISSYAKSLPYDLEYYMPMYIESVFVHHIIYDYMRSLGFKNDFHGDGDSYIYEPGNIYGGGDRICLTFYGLDEINKEKTVRLCYWTKKNSWIETTCVREVEAIKKMINGLLKPLFITDGIASTIMADKMTDEAIDTVLGQISFSSKEFVLKQKIDLKEKLQAIIDVL